MPNDSINKTNDKSIRGALKELLLKDHADQLDTKVVEELGLEQGTSRIDIAVINGILHGYELKGDLDSLIRLPEQMKTYNSIFDKVTLVVGKDHLHNAINMIPNWWGVVIAKFGDNSNKIKFCEIRKSETNPITDCLSIASLLWKDESLAILEKYNEAKTVKYKSKKIINEHLVKVLDTQTLKDHVRKCLVTRQNWRSDTLYALYDD